jgi:hypothetical protein
VTPWLPACLLHAACETSVPAVFASEVTALFKGAASLKHRQGRGLANQWLDALQLVRSGMWAVGAGCVCVDKALPNRGLCRHRQGWYQHHHAAALCARRLCRLYWRLQTFKDTVLPRDKGRAWDQHTNGRMHCSLCAVGAGCVCVG